MMNRKRYYRKIVKYEPSENPKDVLMMIQLIAKVRASNYRPWATIRRPLGSPGRRHYDFAAGIICILLRPLKSEVYLKKASIFRKSFEGISKSRDMQSIFINSLTKYLMSECKTAKEAIKKDFDDLFKRE